MLAKDANDVPMLQSNRATDKANEIANRLLKTTPHLARQLPTDSMFKHLTQNGPAQPTNPVVMPAIKRVDNIKDPKKKGSTIVGGAPTAMTNTSNNFNPMFRPELSVVDWQKKYAELENKCKKLEEDLEVLRHDKQEKEHRYVKRETGYRKLVDELHEELRRDFSLNGEDRKKMEGIAALHSKIMNSINDIQLKTSKVLLDQEKDIIRFFNNKINEIKKQFEEERIKRGKKDQSYEVKEKQLIAELEWIKDIAQKIDQENHTLMKKHMELKAQYATQENDREILLREVILKKKKNAILKSQIDQYEKILEEVSKGKEGENSSLLQEFPGESVDRNQGVNASQGDRRSQLFSAGQDRVQTAATEMRTQNIISKLKSSLQREKKKVQQLKTLYIKELESKSTLEKVLRSCIEDIKDDIFTMQKDKTATKKFNTTNELLDKKDRNGLVEKLINDERILTLIYDKTFYASNKKIEIPPELLRDDEDDNLEGFEE